MRTATYITFAVALLAGAARPAAAQQPRAAASGFWQAVGDTTLSRLVARALDAGQDVRVAQARVSGARAARVGAALDLAPVVTASGGYSRQRISGAAFPGLGGTLPDQDLWDAGLRMAWEFDYAGRLRRGYQGRGALEAASREDVRDVHVALAAQVATAYFALRGAQDQLAVAERNAENQRRTLELTEQRLEAGRGTALDTERARAQLSATLAQVPELEAAIDAARFRVAVLTGAPASAAESFAAPGAPVVLPREVTVDAPESLVRRRPDVRGAERELAASRAFVGAARAEYLPRLALAGTAGYTASQLDALGRAGTPRYAIGPVLSWPALDLGRVRAGVDAARAGEAEARARYEQSVLLASEELETALVRYRKASERLRHLGDAAAASERAAELARLQFQEGGADFLRVLDAERSLLEAQDRLAQGRTEATTRLVAVYRAVGGEWPAAR